MSSSRPEGRGRRRSDNAGRLNLHGRIRRVDVPRKLGVRASSHFNVAYDLSSRGCLGGRPQVLPYFITSLEATKH